MNKFRLILSAAALMTVMVTSCKKDTPKEAASAWLTSFYHMDYEGAKKFSTEDTKNMLSLFAEFSKAAAGSDSMRAEARKLTVKVKDVKQEKDKATATYTVSDHPDKVEFLYLVNQNGHWLVQYSKRDQQTQAAQDMPEPAADTTGDSLEDTTK